MTADAHEIHYIFSFLLYQFSILYKKSTKRNFMNTCRELKRTPLYQIHLDLGAKMAPFGGFEMPIQYDGIIAEHVATRTACTIFDTCHMGEFRFKGASAARDLENILTCRVNSMEIGQCRYGFICNERGGVIDDQILYRIASDEFFMVVNASTQSADFAWITGHLSHGVAAENLSESTGKIDLQGPGAPKIMQKLMRQTVADMKYYRFKYNTYRAERVLTSRTGYTGEIGFEIYGDPQLIRQFFNDCLECGAKPAGLGARDTLRLEMGLPLYGHELDANRNPMESGFTRSIDCAKQFIGSTVVCGPGNVRQTLVGLILSSRRAARAGDTILGDDGTHAGAITSGSYSPSLEKAIALGYIEKKYGIPGTRLQVDTGRQKLDVIVTETPFYRKATCRKNIAEFL